MKRADLARLFVSEAPRLLRRLRGFRGRVIPEDLVQSAFAKLMEQDVNKIEDPRAYLSRLVRNLAVDEVRRQDRVGMASMDEAEFEELLAVRPSPYERPDLSPEEMLIAGERFAHMTAAVLALPERERLALVMFKLKGLSHKEIAERLGVSQHTVPYYLARALAKCRKAMQAFENAGTHGLQNGGPKTHTD